MMEPSPSLERPVHLAHGWARRVLVSLMLLWPIGCASPWAAGEAGSGMGDASGSLDPEASVEGALAPTPDQQRRDPAAGSQKDCLPNFSDEDGWLGGDAAYSIPLPAGPASPERKTLWLFGDSFFQADPRTNRGREYPFLHNTIGISSCPKNGDWQIDYFAGQDEVGRPTDFLRPASTARWVRALSAESNANDGEGDASAAPPDPYYWPFDAFYARGALFIGLLRVVNGPAAGELQLPFQLKGVDLARIENFEDAPRDWKIQISTLSDHSGRLPASAFVVQGEHVYAFTFLDRGDGRSPRTLSRLPLEALERFDPELEDALEFYSQADDWRSVATREGGEPGERILMEDDATEMSVHFDLDQARWLAVYSRLPEAQAQARSGMIWIREAPRLTGPWSEAAPLFRIPETRATNRSGDEQVFCYAGKAHPQFASPSRLVLTYVCNLFARNSVEILPTLGRLVERTDLYRPRAVSLREP